MPDLPPSVVEQIQDIWYAVTVIKEEAAAVRKLLETRVMDHAYRQPLPPSPDPGCRNCRWSMRVSPARNSRRVRDSSRQASAFR